MGLHPHGATKRILATRAAATSHLVPQDGSFNGWSLGVCRVQPQGSSHSSRVNNRELPSLGAPSLSHLLRPQVRPLTDLSHEEAIPAAAGVTEHRAYLHSWSTNPGALRSSLVPQQQFLR